MSRQYITRCLARDNHGNWQGDPPVKGRNELERRSRNCFERFHATIGFGWEEFEFFKPWMFMPAINSDTVEIPGINGILP